MILTQTRLVPQLCAQRRRPGRLRPWPALRGRHQPGPGARRRGQPGGYPPASRAASSLAGSGACAGRPVHRHPWSPGRSTSRTRKARTKWLQTVGRMGEEQRRNGEDGVITCRDQVVRATPGGRGRDATGARLPRQCAPPRKAMMLYHRPNREGTGVGTGCRPNSVSAPARTWVVTRSGASRPCLRMYSVAASAEIPFALRMG